MDRFVDGSLLLASKVYRFYRVTFTLTPKNATLAG